MRKSDVISLRKTISNKADKSNDLDIIVSAFIKLPYGQLKKVLTDEVLVVLEKYGYTV